jgi:hypothetical protein
MSGIGGRWTVSEAPRGGAPGVLEATMNTRLLPLRIAAGTAVLAGAALLGASPSYASPPPEIPASSGSTEGHVPTRDLSADGEDVPAASGLSAQVRAKLGVMERAQTELGTTDQSDTGSSHGPDPANLLTLVGAALLAGTATVTVRRVRRHAPPGPELA